MAGGYSAPGVYRREVDISDILVSQGISNGATVIRSQKGPIRRPVLVTNNKEFIENFGAPYYISGCSDLNIGGSLVPEFGYGSYGALEFLKESSVLYVVRAYDDDEDMYANVKINSNGTMDDNLGVAPISSSIIPDRFDTKTYISTYEEYANGTILNPIPQLQSELLVGYVSPGTLGNNVAVTIETLTPNSDWLYRYDNYPTSAEAVENTITVVGETSAVMSSVPAIWSGNVTTYNSYGNRFVSLSGTGGSLSGTGIWLQVSAAGYTPTTTSGTIAACTETWKYGYGDTNDATIFPQGDGLTFSYTPYTSGATISGSSFTSATYVSYTESPTEYIYKLLLDTDSNGSYYQYDYKVAKTNVTTTTSAGIGSENKVKEYFKIASDVCKISVYVKPENVESWDDLYVDSTDKTNKKLRIDPVEVYYGSLKQVKDDDGNDLFIERSINGVSKYVYVKVKTGASLSLSSCWNFGNPQFKLPNLTDTRGDYILTDRLLKLNGGAVKYTHGMGTDSEFWSYFENREELPIQIVINPSYQTVDKQAVSRLCSARKDCIATNQVGSVNVLDYTGIIDEEKYGYPAPSFMSLYSGYSKIYDTYNDKYVYLPNSIFASAVFARVDRVAYPWYAPAGVDRATLSVLDQNKVFSEMQIGMMYDKNINSVKLIKGAGFVIFGQKTAQLKKSALDRIQVRRNLIYIENNIENALQQFVFENNTRQTQLRIYSIIDEFLSGVKASEGLYEYDVVCDESNNTPAVIDANQLNVDIYVQPVKSAEFIQFTTVVTRTGVSFTDVKLKYA